jgi:predicted nucleotidyltransferase
MHSAISKYHLEIANVCVIYGVKKLEVFGSAARAIDFDPTISDADFVVKFGEDQNFTPLEEYFGLRDALANLLGRPVDLVEYDAVKNPFVRRQIDASRELIFHA